LWYLIVKFVTSGICLDDINEVSKEFGGSKNDIFIGPPERGSTIFPSEIWKGEGEFLEPF
jgi:hypothetical protein